MKRLRSALQAHVGGLPPQFWWMWGGAFVSALATFVFLFLAVYLTARGFDPQRVGSTVAAFGLGSLAAGPIGGTLADRIGRRPTLLGALIASATFAAFIGFVRAPALIAIGVFAFGLAATSVFPAVSAMVADVVAEPDRPRAFGMLYWANNIGVSLSAVVGGAIGERSWTALFLADAATTLLFAAIVRWRVAETRPAGAVRGPAAASQPERGWGAVVADRGFVAFIGVWVAFLVVFFQFQVAAPIAMSRAGLTPARIGRVLAVNGLLIGALQPFAARVFGGRDPGRVLALGAVLVGGGYAAYALCDTTASYAAATAVWTLGEIMTMPVAVALVAELAPVDLRGRYIGAYSLAFGAGQTLAPLVGGSALALAGADALFTGCLVVCLAAAAAHLALGAARRRRRDSRAPSP
jgi:MFS family permease